MPITYIPKSATGTYDDLSILRIYLIVRTKNPVSITSGSASSSAHDPHANHWVIHLAISQNSSTQLDPSPDANNALTLIISKTTTTTTTKDSGDAVKTVEISAAAPNLTVGNVIEHICNAQYDRYRFTISGQGCRYWICSVLGLLRSAGCVTDGLQVEAAVQALRSVWDEDGTLASGEQQSGIMEGEFLKSWRGEGV